MRRTIAAAVLALAMTGPPVSTAASRQTVAAPDPKIGTRITITGCLHQGTSSNSFVLLGVTERLAASAPAPVVPVPFAIYSLDSTDGLKPLVGQMIDVTGIVTKRESKRGIITVDIRPEDTLSTEINVESESRDVTTEKFKGAEARQGASKAASTIAVTRPVYKLDVKDVRAVNVYAGGPACR